MKSLKEVLRKFFSQARHSFVRLSLAKRIAVLTALVIALSGTTFFAIRLTATPVPVATSAPADSMAVKLFEKNAPATSLIVVRDKIKRLEAQEGTSSFTIRAQFADGSSRNFAPVSPFTYKTLQDMLAPDIAAGKINLQLKSIGDDEAWTTEEIFNVAGQAISILAIAAILFVMLGKSTLMDGRMRAAELIKPEANTDHFDALIGLEDVKAEVMQLKAMYEDADRYRSYGIEKPFNVLFSGPAGVGKTRLAGALARELGLPLLHASGSNLESGFVGGGSRALKSIHKQARKHKRAVVFLDEAQVLLVKRGQQNSSNSKWADDTTNTLLSILDGVSRSDDKGIIWIVASNFDDQNMQVDDAVMRRFPLKVNFRLPNLDERERILRHYLSKRASRVAETLNINHVAEVTSGLSPALLESLVERASLIAIQEDGIIDEDILMRAFERIAVGLTDRKTTEHHKQARKTIAVHELGHFFVTLHETMKHSKNMDELKANLPVLKISTEAVSKGGALGFVLMRQKDAPLSSRSELEGKVRGLYGGVAAEEVFFGQDALTTGAYDDIRKITDMLQKMVVELAMYSNSKVNMSMLSGGEGDKQRSTEEIKQHAERLFKDALAVIEQHRETIAVLADELVARYTFTIDEILVRLRGMGVVRFADEKMQQESEPIAA